MRQLWVLVAYLVCFPVRVRAVDLLISNPEVNGFEISVSASLSASANYYLQGTLRSQSSSKYFGETANNRGDWVDYLSSPEKEYITSNFFVTDVKNASWSGQIKLRFKADDPNYQGPGLYDLKLRRFTGGSTSSAGDSNTLTLTLSQALPTPSPTPTPSPSPSPYPSPTPTPTPSAVTAIPTPIPSLKPTPSPELSSPPDGSVAGAATIIDLSGFGEAVSPSPSLSGDARKVPTLNQARAKTALTLGSGIVLITISAFFGYRRYHAIINP